jgi:hypothetical protein
VFSFQFVNSFASLFYIGFVKPYIPTIDACVNLSCMTELQTTLGTIFLMRVTIGNVTELGTFLVTALFVCAWCAPRSAKCYTSRRWVAILLSLQLTFWFLRNDNCCAFLGLVFALYLCCPPFADCCAVALLAQQASPW